MTAAGLDAVVVGAGIGGAAAALLLARAGARVRLLERVAEPRAVGAGILLQPNGLGVLYGLGLGEALCRRAVRGRRVDLADAAGRVLLSGPIPDLGGGYDHVLVLRRSHLQTTLLDAVAREPRVTCAFGCEVVAARPDGTLEAHGPGGPQALRADLVVGADGLHSRLRAAGDFRPTITPGITYVRGLAASRPARVMTEYWTSLGIFGAGPVDDALYFYASTQAPPLAAALARRDLAGLRAAWARACPVAASAFDGVPDFDALLVTQATRVDCARWVDGRLVLLGDAAHAMAPNAGQGANSALVDAAVLADALVTVPDRDGALAAYAARRRPAVRRVQDVSAMLGRLGEIRHPALRWGRDNLVRVVLGAMGSDRSVRLGQQEDPVWLERVARRRT